MAKLLRPILFSYIIISVFVSKASAQSCKSYTFSGNKLFSSCNDLSVLSSFIHWNYDPSTGKVQIAYRHTGIESSQWVAWAINPNSKGMEGSQALVAYQQPDGTMAVYTSPVDTYGTKLEKGNLSFAVSDLSATYSNNEITIFATLVLPKNATTVNQVWQNGPVKQNKPTTHDTTGPNILSMASLDFLSGSSTAPASGGGNSKLRKRNIHGVLNAVSWGIMMPLGAVIARYLKVFRSADPAWFYLHATCQTSAYIVGVAGWATGIKLGSESSGIQYDTHRNIGITLFILGTLQVLALLLRPNKDHKYRFYWNIYHHTVGYIVIILSIINIFKGFSMLNPEKKWKNGYIGIIAALAVVAFLLEVYTWYIVMQMKKFANLRKMQAATNGANGANGANGYGTRPQQPVL